MPSQISPCGTQLQPVTFSSMMPSQSSSMLLQPNGISLFGSPGVPAAVGSQTRPIGVDVHVPVTVAPAALTTLHALPADRPLHAVCPESQPRPVPSVRHTFAPLTRHLPWRPLVHIAALPGKSSSISESQSSSRLLHVSVLIAPARIWLIASWRPASSLA